MRQRRFKPGLRRIERILRANSVGRLGLCQDGDVYVVPLNHCYRRGRLILHCGFTGRKLDMLRSNSRVCYEVDSCAGMPADHSKAACAVHYESVICFGRAWEVEDVAERARMLTAFRRHFEGEGRGRIELERAAECNVIEMKIERMTACIKHGGERVFLEHRFADRRRR